MRDWNMTCRALIYVVRDWHYPGDDYDGVPCPIGYDMIFFGPCKIRLREKLKQDYLEGGKISDYRVPREERVYVVGVNGSNPDEIRQIVFVGKITRIMTFEKAFQIISRDRRLRDMFQHPCSQLHVKPVYRSNRFIGYRHRSEEHKTRGEWVWDLVDPNHERLVETSKELLILKPRVKRENAFSRDCCFLCKRIWYGPPGLAINDEMLSIIRRTLPEDKRKTVTDYAIFGKDSKNRADGLRGKYHEIVPEKFAARFVSQIPKGRQGEPQEKTGQLGKCNW